MTITEDFIAHFGVRGMKWGVRKRSSGGKKATTGKKSKGKVSDMSDEELGKKVKRMNMEKQYISLKKNKRDQSIVRKGAKVTGEILGKSAKKSLTSFSTAQMTNALEKAAARKTRTVVSTATAGTVG